jgi:hypothetical protein
MMNQQTLIASTAQRLVEQFDKGSRAGRVEVSGHLSFMDDQEFEGEGTLLDISLRGCRMVSDDCLQVGNFLKLSIGLPDQMDPLRVDKAIVRWVEQGQVGLEFVSLRLEELDRLCALSLAAESGRPVAER